jgi:hypothetical protein
MSIKIKGIKSLNPRNRRRSVSIWLGIAYTATSVYINILLSQLTTTYQRGTYSYHVAVMNSQAQD